MTTPNLEESILEFANLKSCNLEQANLTKLNLSFAQFSKTEMPLICLSEAVLEGANLVTQKILTKVQLNLNCILLIAWS